MLEMSNLNTCMEYLTLQFVTVLNVSVVVSGDPREFFIDVLHTHFPEFQVQYGFGLKTDSKTIYHLHIYIKYNLSSAVAVHFNITLIQGYRIKCTHSLFLQYTVLTARTISHKL